jgi:outer membrane protein assembly factor BamB
MLTIAATLITCLPAVNAASEKTYAFLTVRPNPVGVGQTVFVVFWLSQPPPPGPPPPIFWEGLTVTVTKPDNTTVTLGPFKSDYVGSQYTSYVPETTGTYYFQLSYPGQTIGANYYEPTTSPKVALTVQQEPIAEWPAAPLPTDYWQRPIYGENREWWSLGGNWLLPGYNASGSTGSTSGGAFAPYTTAPKSAHVMWRRPVYFGGVVGGELGDKSYTMQFYEQMFYPIVISGRLYYSTYTYPKYGFYCIDLRTGEEIWWHNVTAPSAKKIWGNLYAPISLGQVYYFSSMNQQGALAYLWSLATTYSLYDAWTGNWICDFANASAASMVGPMVFGGPSVKVSYGRDGSLLVYMLEGTNNWFAMWNSSKAINPTGAANFDPPTGQTVDWKRGLQWNVTVPDVPGVLTISEISRDVIVATTASAFGVNSLNYSFAGYSAKDGHQLWVFEKTFPTYVNNQGLLGALGEGVLTLFQKETMQWTGYDAYTGQQIWGPTEPYTNAWGMYNGPSTIAYGKLYTTGYDGMLHCYDVTNGDHLWDFWTGSSGLETPYGHWPMTYGGLTVADGKVFVEAAEHSPTNPYWRGGKLYAIDAQTGKQLWNISSMGDGILYSTLVTADGYLTAYNIYGNQIYCYGKGQTATTVTAPLTTVANGSSVLIQGTVTDQSPGAKGTPAIADKYMTQWMEYLYHEKPMPTDITGVPVQLQAIGSDGTVINIGTVTSDAMGNFKYAFCPTKPDVYTILATFPGSDSYYSSYASTGVAVGPSPAAAEPVEIPAYPDNTPIFAGMTVAIVVVAILVVYTLYTVRKQKK